MMAEERGESIKEKRACRSLSDGATPNYAEREGEGEEGREEERKEGERGEHIT